MAWLCEAVKGLKMIFNINLLPWRLQKKRYKKRCFQYCIIAIFLLSSFIVSVVNSYLNHLIQRQTVHYQQLMNQKHQLDLAIKKANKNNIKWIKNDLNMKFIHKVYSHRDCMVRILKFLQQIVPSEVVLNRIERKKNKMTLYCVIGCQKLHYALSKNASFLLLKQSKSDKKDCKIQFKLRPNTI